jgi:hypothetical protein
MNTLKTTLGAALLASVAVIAAPVMAQGSAGTTGAAVGSQPGATVTATGIAPADGSNRIEANTTVMGANSMEVKPNVPTVVIGGPSLQVLNAPQNTVNNPTFQRWMKLR